MLVLVVYDIADDRRRVKLSNFLEGQGRRVQESVFECFLSLDEMKKLHGQVLKRVKPELDNVRFYWVPVDAVARTLTIPVPGGFANGSKVPEQPPEFYIV